jgi:hypothetical protein
VKPAHAERFAISVWYGDAAAIAEAKEAERPITARPLVCVSAKFV